MEKSPPGVAIRKKLPTNTSSDKSQSSDHDGTIKKQEQELLPPHPPSPVKENLRASASPASPYKLDCLDIYKIGLEDPMKKFELAEVADFSFNTISSSNSNSNDYDNEKIFALDRDDQEVEEEDSESGDLSSSSLYYSNDDLVINPTAATSEDANGLEQLFIIPPIRDEWRSLFDLFDPEGFGEILLDDFEAALDSREFVTHISPGKLIILRDRVLSHRQMGIQAFTFQEFVNTLSGKRTLSFKCAMHSKDRQVSQPGDFHLRREDSIFSISDRLTEVLANEALGDEVDRKWFLSQYQNRKCRCCLWPPPLFLLTLGILQIVFYYYNSVAEHPLVLHPLKLHEPWRYLTYCLVHVDLHQLVINLLVQGLVGLPLETVHGSFRIAIIYFSGVIAGSVTASIFDPHVRLAGASGAAYALLSAHVANIILHHASIARPFLRLIGLVFIASLEVGCGIYRRYAPEEPDRPQVSFAAHFGGLLAGLTLGLVVLKNYEQKLCERRMWWLAFGLLFALSFAAFAYQIIRGNPDFTIFCSGQRCPESV